MRKKLYGCVKFSRDYDGRFVMKYTHRRSICTKSSWAYNTASCYGVSIYRNNKKSGQLLCSLLCIMTKVAKSAASTKTIVIITTTNGGMNSVILKPNMKNELHANTTHTTSIAINL